MASFRPHRRTKPNNPFPALVMAAAVMLPLSPGHAEPGSGGRSLAGLNSPQNDRFLAGHAIFDRKWSQAEGLGPAFNQNSCRACHAGDGRRNGGAADTVSSIPTAVLRFGVSPQTEIDISALKGHLINTLPEPSYGFQLQTRGKTEGTLRIAYKVKNVPLKDGTIVELREPVAQMENLTDGAPEPGTMRSLRIGSALNGLGLLAAVPEADILVWADAEDADGDGISGRANRVWDIEKNGPALGRFGWKAGQPSLLQQTASAFAIDMGLTSVLFPKGDDADSAETEDVGRDMLNRTADYLRWLPPPTAPHFEGETVEKGKLLFNGLGCAGCHRPSMKTGNDPRLPEHYRAYAFRPYTDLLLHDLGTGLADRFIEGKADFWEWRTAPLWGIGPAEASGQPTLYLHDGRARSLIEAILWHGGEAMESRDGFAGLNRIERDSLIAFLKSL